MSDTRVSLLTPPGTGAIATVEVRGPRAWELARALFTPVGKPLPDAPELHCFWFGTLGKDEVILAVTAPDAIEVHCHGGRRVVRWVMDQFLASGGRESPECATSECVVMECATNECARTEVRRDALGGLTSPARLLERAPTLRTASIILDQLNGAFATEVRRILALLETDPQAAALALNRLAELGNTVGRHLIEPWKVVVAGPPNVGKSSLINALAGYQRSVVSEVAGTTRDAVSVQVAFDGWPVELIDTAGLRDAEGLEEAGISRARDEITDADLVLWVLDAMTTEWELPSDAPLLHAVFNKCDTLTSGAIVERGFPLVSARTGEGIASLAVQLVARLAPKPPSPGAAVPFTPQLIEQVSRASQSATQGDWDTAKHHLRAALAHSEGQV